MMTRPSSENPTVKTTRPTPSHTVGTLISRDRTIKSRSRSRRHTLTGYQALRAMVDVVNDPGFGSYVDPHPMRLHADPRGRPARETTQSACGDGRVGQTPPKPSL